MTKAKKPLTDRELDQLVAERVMGWRLCHDYRGSEKLETTHYRDEKNRRRERFANYTTSLTDDYDVLAMVREKWEDDKFFLFLDAVNDLWKARMETDERFGNQEPWSCYLPGDYSKSALAALAVKETL